MPDLATEYSVLNDQENLESCRIASLLENLQGFRYSKKYGEVPHPNKVASTAVYNPKLQIRKMAKRYL